LGGKALAQYAKKQNQTTATIIYNSQSNYSQSLKNVFKTNLVKNGGKIALEADLSQENFNPAEILQQANSQKTKVLVFLNDSSTVDRAYLLMQLNHRQLQMLAGDSFFKPQTLQVGGQKAVGMVLAVPWHISSSKNLDFSASARHLWRGDVGWRTAMAYDSTKALAVGLGNSQSRQGIQKTLSRSNFAFEGASGTVKFLASGDRNQIFELITIVPGQRSSFGYDFVPLTDHDSN
jgi:branched-chain amino acid transport system substrate-binding protein